MPTPIAPTTAQANTESVKMISIASGARARPFPAANGKEGEGDHKDEPLHKSKSRACDAMRAR